MTVGNLENFLPSSVSYNLHYNVVKMYMVYCGIHQSAIH